MKNRIWSTLDEEFEGQLRVIIQKHRTSQIYMISVEGMQEEAGEDDESNSGFALNRALRRLESYNPCLVIWDLTCLRALGLTSMVDIEDCNRRLGLLECRSAMILRNDLRPHVALIRLVSLFHQEKDVHSAVRWLLNRTDRTPASRLPSWMQIAGVLFGAVTLLFFMVVAFLSFKNQVPGSGSFSMAVLALGATLSTGLLGGTAIASGELPLLRDKAVEFSMAGIAAILLLMLVVGRLLLH